MTTVEAMAGGCVPVVIDLAGQREIVKAGVDGFRWSTPEQLLDGPSGSRRTTSCAPGCRSPPSLTRSSSPTRRSRTAGPTSRPAADLLEP